MATHSEIASQLRQGLAASIPDLDTSVGTPIRKILDVFAEGLAESHIDQHLLDYRYDIDAMSGADLDAFVELFGMVRFSARRANGTITFARGATYILDIPIPAGTQLSDDASPPHLFQTTLSAKLPAGDTSLEIPAQAVAGGTDSNVGAGEIIRVVTPLAGLSSLTNTIAFSGGMDEESDAELRVRFRRTALRHLAGTEAMYLGIALEDPDVHRVNVIGSYKRRFEQIEIGPRSEVQTITVNATAGTFTVTWSGQTTSALAFDISAAAFTTALVALSNIAPGDVVVTGGPGNAGGTTPYTLTWLDTLGNVAAPTTNAGSLTGGAGTAAVATVTAGHIHKGISTVEDAAWVFPDRETVGENVIGGDILAPTTHYTFDDTAIPPTLLSVDQTDMPDGIYEIEYDYLPLCSRNDPAADVLNRVDLFIDGVRSATAVESFRFSDDLTFNTTPSHENNVEEYRRLDESTPTSGNYFTPLSFGPLVAMDDEITSGPDTYVEGTDYWLVNNVGVAGLSSKSLAGIEWANSGAPDDGDQMSVTYEYNEIPGALDIALRTWRLVTQDVMVHQAKRRLLNMHLVVIVSPGATGVEDAVYARLKRFVDAISFDTVLQTSDILTEAHLIVGVDAVRFATSDDDDTDYAIQWIDPTGDVLTTYDDGGTVARAVDVSFADDELPILNAVTLDVRAQNTFGQGA